MPNVINFDEGLKQYTINGDENRVIKFKPTDFDMIARMKKTKKVFEKYAEEMKNKGASSEEPFEMANEYSEKIKEQINYMFGYDIADVVFEKGNCLSICDNDNPVFLNFFNAVFPIITQDIEETQKKLDKNVKKYTSQAEQFK